MLQQVVPIATQLTTADSELPHRSVRLRGDRHRGMHGGSRTSISCTTRVDLLGIEWYSVSFVVWPILTAATGDGG